MGIYFTDLVDGQPAEAATFNPVLDELDGQLVALSDGTGFDNQGGNLVLAGPAAGGSGAVSFRALVAADIPALDASQVGSGVLDVARIPALPASQIDSGTFDAARLPVFVGADGLDAGEAGSVPAPDATDQDKFLRGDGDWAAPDGGELGPALPLVIDAGAITASAANHTVDTEGAAATDDLETINGVAEGDLLYVMAANAARTVVVKHGSGNIRLNGGVDFSLDNTEKGLLLVGAAGELVIGVGVPMQTGAGSGTVTSVGLSLPSVFDVSGSPVTTSGTLTAAFASGQAANQVLASPDGTTGAVALRGLVADDIPALSAAKIDSGTLDVARIPDLPAGKIDSGTLDAARLPVFVGADGLDAGEAGSVPAPDATDQDKFLRGDGTWAAVASGIDVAIFSQQMASGVAGGSATQEAWTARPLNTTVANVGGHASLASNQITLDPGTYHVTAWSVYAGSSYLQTRLYNVTGSSVAGLGTSVRSMPGANQPTYFGHLATVVTVSSATVFEYQYWLTLARPTDGLGFAASTGSPEVYASVQIVKVG